MAEPSALPTVENIIPAPQEAPPASESTSGTLPNEILEIPAIAGLLHGAPPAVYADRKTRTPEIEAVIANAKPLEEAGFGIFNSVDGKNAVLFNSAYVSQKELEKADKEGKLTEVVPSFESVQSQFGAAISGEAASALPGVAAGPAPSGPPPSSKVQDTLATKRANNLQVGSPTSGPKPGAGRILNNILRPTI